MNVGKYSLTEREGAALMSIKTIIAANKLNIDETQNILKVLQSACSRKAQRRARSEPCRAQEAGS